ncbi:MAG: MnmC family methyltransferase [Nevskiales bacterium]|nr:MnmC family methyltransferase [Nevskiales bacterium]
MSSRAPLLSLPIHQALCRARDRGLPQLECSMDLGRSSVTVEIGADTWGLGGQRYPYPEKCKDRTLYHWDAEAGRFAPVSRYGDALIKLVPTEWGAPTFEIDGIKMLPTARVSPYEDARRKVELIQPRGKRILDTCGGLGYFAACCLDGGALRIDSFEKNADVIWLRTLNPWSPDHRDPQATQGRLHLTHGDVAECIAELPDAAYDAALHDPPRFGIAGELYSQAFYDQLARVLKPHARLFHYTGTPNKLTSGRDVPREVSARLQRAGFSTEVIGDGVLAIRNRQRPSHRP